jgi:hypothetical protein
MLAAQAVEETLAVASENAALEAPAMTPETSV